MATEKSVRIGSRLFAIALFAALAIEAGIAQEADSGARDAGGLIRSGQDGLRPFSGADDAGDAAKFEKKDPLEGKSDAGQALVGEGNRNGTQAPLKNANPINAGGEPEGIDTRMMVHAHRLGGRREKIAEVKAKIGLISHSRPAPRRWSRPTTLSDRIVRNSVGLPLARRESLERRDGGHRDVPTTVPAPVIGAVGISGNAGIAKRESGLDRSPILRTGAGPIVSPTAANRGTINATGLAHRFSAPSGIGGPARIAAGINGTTIRPKH
ncbi:MAG TPA: hypothetical protein VK430_11645 [Xanthobacteraceae bacterium]|nr:hypothetical protein [Xanthobacteraceae bacterium]